MSDTTTKVETGKKETIGERIKRAPTSIKVAAGLLAALAATKADDLYDVAFKKGSASAGQEERAISPAEAMGKVGQRVTVEMRVDSEKYFDFSRTHNLNEGRFPRQTFTIRVQDAGGKVATAGQTVRATGIVSMYEGKPQLTVKAGDVKVK